MRKRFLEVGTADFLVVTGRCFAFIAGLPLVDAAAAAVGEPAALRREVVRPVAALVGGDPLLELVDAELLLRGGDVGLPVRDGPLLRLHCTSPWVGRAPSDGKDATGRPDRTGRRSRRGRRGTETTAEAGARGRSGGAVT